MEIKELSYSFFKYWKEQKWQEITNSIHENVKFNLFWCDLELQGKENFVKALKEGKNSFSIREIELINSYGKEVIAVTLNTQGMTDQEKIFHKQLISKDLDIPVFLPIDEGLDGILEILESKFYEN